MSVDVICAECGAMITNRSPSQISERNFCNHACLGKYRSKHYTGERSAHWKGGIRKNRDRVLVHAPGHPAAQANGCVYRYRLVAEEMLGRVLLPNEIVHHKDGDESNDDPRNLVVTTQSVHARALDAHRPVRGVIPATCGKGHPLTSDNLYLYSRFGLTKWTCRICRRANERRYEQRRKHRASV